MQLEIPFRQKTLNDFDKKFKAIEQESLLIPNYSPDKFLCIRLDGIKVSKTLLKDKLVNQFFDKSLASAIKTVYFLCRGFTPIENLNFFVSAFSASDEVSFILNKGENYYKNRPHKISTVFAGNFSSAMTIQNGIRIKQSKEKKIYPKIIAFDARPLILRNKEEIKDYIYYRWMLYYRNSMCKVLRLTYRDLTNQIYNTGLKDDIYGLGELINKYDVVSQLETALTAAKIYQIDGKMNLKGIMVNSYEKLEDNLRE